MTHSIEARTTSQAQNIDVVAALFYAALSRSLLRAATGNGRADDKLVGMLQVLLKASTRPSCMSPARTAV